MTDPDTIADAAIRLAAAECRAEAAEAALADARDQALEEASKVVFQAVTQDPSVTSEAVLISAAAAIRALKKGHPMTDKDLTASEAVERLAKSLAFVANRTGLTVEKCEQITDDAAATLRALSAKVETERAANFRLRRDLEIIVDAYGCDCAAEIQAVLKKDYLDAQT